MVAVRELLLGRAAQQTDRNPAPVPQQQAPAQENKLNLPKPKLDLPPLLPGLPDIPPITLPTLPKIGGGGTLDKIRPREAASDSESQNRLLDYLLGG